MKIDETLVNRIKVNPKVMIGKPTVRGLRITVEQILNSLAAGLTFESIKDDYPMLEKEDI